MKKLFIVMIVAAMAVGACGGKKAAPAQTPAAGSDMTAPAAGSGDAKPAEGGGETTPPAK
jgi:hypothetical protein